MFVTEFYFDSYGCQPPVNIMKQIKNGLYSENQIQTDDSFFAAGCLYILFLTHLIGFKTAVLHIYYQVFMNNE